MVDISYHRKDRDGIPVFSANELENIGDALIKDFCPEVISKPREVDIEVFSEFYMGFKQDFQYLSHCGFILGMMVYENTDFIPVYNPQLREAEFVHADKDTIIIDKSLLYPQKQHRYRFTLAHEAAGHGVLHRNLFNQKNAHNETILYGHDGLQCSDKVVAPTKNALKSATPVSWLEWQANILASAVLMPRLSIEKALKNCRNCRLWDVNDAYDIVVYIYQLFNVSRQAALIRLQKLGYIDSKMIKLLAVMFSIF